MANPSQGSQAAGAAGGTRGAHQSMVVLFERDESLAGLVLGQLRGLGYECRPARTPVEVFDSIARYPVGLVLVNLGQAATGRREFWVALDSQRRGRGVQVLTYRQVIPGVEPEPDSSGRTPLADVEMRGPQGYLALVEMVRARLAPPARQAAESDFLLSGPMRAQPPKGQPPAPAPAPIPPKLEAAVPQQIAGVLNLHAGPYAGQPPDFSPLPAGQNGATNGRAMGAWTPEMPGGWTMTPATLQTAPEPPDTRLRQWPGERPPDDAPTQMAPGRSALPPPEPPAQAAAKADRTAPANDPGGGGPLHPPDGMSPANGASAPRSGPPVPPTMPMGDLAGLTDAINALAAAGAPGYHNAVAAAQAVNTASMPNNGETPRWAREYAPPAQEVRGYPAPNQDGSMMNNQGMGDAPRYSPPAQANGARQPSGPMAAGNQPNSGHRPGAAENLYADQQAFAEMRQTQEPTRAQPSQSRSLGDSLDEFEQFRRERAAQQRGPGEEPPSLAWRPSGGNMAPLNPPPGYQNQHLAAVALPGHVERALGNVLVEGQLVSQQRLEVALGIQRLLRGADIDYRLGELLLLFKFLTPDQLLAALLVSRGLVTPTQVAAMGRIKQELHVIGMEYDLENLLILFRLLSSEQLREIRSEFP